MEKIIKAEDLPMEEKVYLRKSFDGWRVVYPNKNEDGSRNWKNTISGGSWWNLLKVIILVLLILLVVYEYSSNIEKYQTCFTGPAELELCKKMFGAPVFFQEALTDNPLQGIYLGGD